jgi:hypothetical protein
VVNGGRLSPFYQFVGTLGIPALTFNTTGGADFEFDGSNDIITISNPGGLTLGKAALNLFQTGTNLPFGTNGVYTLFDYDTSFNGSLNGAFTIANSQPGKFYAINNNAVDTTIELTIGDALTTAWSNNTGGSWNTAANWTNGVPNGGGAAVTFGSVLLTSPGDVTLDGSKTIGAITFESGESYNIVPTSCPELAGPSRWTTGSPRPRSLPRSAVIRSPCQSRSRVRRIFPPQSAQSSRFPEISLVGSPSLCRTAERLNFRAATPWVAR